MQPSAHMAPSQPHIDLIQHEAQQAEAVCRLLDTVVVHTYGEQRKIIWHPIAEPASITCDFALDTTQAKQVDAMICASIALLLRLGWDEAAKVLHAVLLRWLQQDICEGSALYDATSKSRDTTACYAAVMGLLEAVDKPADHKTSEFAHKALETAKAQSEKIKTFVEQDLSRVTEGVKKEAQEKLNVSRLSAGILASTSKLLRAAGKALAQVGDKAEQALTCKSGEITNAGKLVCKSCGYEMHFKKTGRIPPCPKCHKTEFIKGY